MPQRWTTEAIPDLAGKVAVVTGANGGLGAETCLALAKAGAEVVMACRDTRKGGAVADAIRQKLDAATLHVIPLDLADLSSIHHFADTFSNAYTQLDLLINNAGIIGMPLRRTTDGFELQMGVDCLGHFALTGLLLGCLRQSPAARVVSVGTSSHPHSLGRIDVNDLNWHKRRYSGLKATLQAKLAFQLCTFELDRRLAERGDRNIIAVVAHPGIANTNISLTGAQAMQANIKVKALRVFNRFFTQSAYKGALPTLYAATASDIGGGDYIGPNGFLELWGYPRHLKSGAIMRDRTLATDLWQAAEACTGVQYLSK